MREKPVVLIVEDERDLADLYERWLTDDYEIRTVHTGEDVLEVVDNTIDIVLLDRRLPDMSGEEVLGRIQEQGIDCQVAMVTAVDPDFDILKLDIDEYLTKPVSKDELRTVVEQLLSQRTFDDDMQRFFSLASKKQALEAEKSKSELRENTEYEVLTTELTDLRQQVNTRLAEHIEPETDSYLRYPMWRILVDSFVIGLVAVVLVAIHFVIPNVMDRLLAYGSPRSDIGILFLTTFVHVDSAHLFGNVGGYLIIAYFTYVVCLRIRAARWFYLTTPILLIILPLVTSLISYEFFAMLYPQLTPVFLGFSGVVAGFVGFSFLAFLVLIRTVYDHRSVFFVGVFILLIALDALVWIYDDTLFFMSVTGSGLIFVLFMRERMKSGWRVTEEWTLIIKQLAVILMVAFVFAGFGLGLIPTIQFRNSRNVWILGHLLGLLVGFGIAFITALLLNLFPIRERIRRDGHTLPRNLL